MHGSNFHLVVQSLDNFSFTCNMLDVVLFTLLRTAMVIGAAVGVLWNPLDGRERVEGLKKLALFVSCLNGYYVCIKLLLYSESNPDK